MAVPAGIRSSDHVINHHLTQTQLQICYKKLEVIGISLSDLRVQVVVFNLSIMLFIILMLIIASENRELEKQ